MKDLYTVGEAAESLGINARSFYRYIERGLIPHKNLSGKCIILTRDNLRLVMAVNHRWGRQGIRDGLCVQA